tara:strand:+ start:46 stop:678 length:633 start_codon:yes stop_codon:yes gene_type:complete
MDLKTGRASSWKKEYGGNTYQRPDTKLDVVEINGTLNTNGSDVWKVKSYGEGSGAYNSTFGSGDETNPTITQGDTSFNPTAATFNTFGRSVKIESAMMCVSKQGGAADSTLSIGISYIDCRNVTDLEGGDVAAGSAFDGTATTFTSTFLAKATGLLAPNATQEFRCHDMGSTFKGLVIPEGCMVYVCIKDETGGTGNAIGINGSFTLQML